MALGTVLPGFSASPAATPTSSVPWKEKPATMKMAMMPVKPLTNGASPAVQLWKPGEGPPRMPRIMSTPSTRKITTVMTLMRENQNSPSPYARALRALRVKRMTRNSADQIHAGVSGNQ